MSPQGIAVYPRHILSDLFLKSHVWADLKAHGAEKRRALHFSSIPLWVLLAASSVLWAEGPVITEFMAAKTRLLADEDGEYPDWIEILNTGTAELSLAGYYLTDDKDVLTRWKMPDVMLGPQRFLVVFASGKDRTKAGAPLHTNFRLSASEYLVLVAPDGHTVVSGFGPRYPFQVDHVSYGIPMRASTTVPVSAGAVARVLVPVDDSLGATWTEPDFDDAAWVHGTTGIGFDRKPIPTYTSLLQTDIQREMAGVNSGAYIRLPFTLSDTAVMALVLAIKYDDGFAAYLNGHEVGRRSAPERLTWDASAAASRRDEDALVFEEIDLSNHFDVLRVGTNVLAIHGLNSSKTDDDFLIAPELRAIRASVDVGFERYFATPTPGGPNSAGATGVAEDPEFTPPGGLFSAPFQLKLETASINAVIKYTLDGSSPTEASATYSAPLPIRATTVVRARVYAPNLIPSPPITQTYLAMDSNDTAIRDFSSNLPIVVFETFGRGVTDRAYTTANAVIIDTADGRSSLKGTPHFRGPAAIKVHGSSSLVFPKKSYNLEIRDDDGDERKVSLFGFPKESDWVLYAPYLDKILMKNVIAYDWSNAIGRYGVRTRFVEVFIHVGQGKISYADSYQGVYVLMEKIKQGKDRVNIQKLYPSQVAEPEITGGYLIKRDWLDPGDSGFSTNRVDMLAFVDPKEKEAPAAQRAWIRNYVIQFESALFGAGFQDPENGYPKFIDVDSFIDHYILVELTKNLDGFRTSTFMFKDRGGRLNMGPIWDYDRALGFTNPDGWSHDLVIDGVSEGVYSWYRRIFEDPTFVVRYCERWVALRQGPLKISRLLSTVDQYAALLSEAQVRDYQKWSSQFDSKEFAEAIDGLRNWLRARVEWIDGMLVPQPTFNQDGGQIPLNFPLAMSSTLGTVYYTFDDSDPRQEDGSTAPSAAAYTEPIPITQNVRVKARSKRGEVWSRLKQDTFVVTMPPLVITEILFAPSPPFDGSTFRADDFEFIEVKNLGSAELDLTGFRIIEGIGYEFSSGLVTRLRPGAYGVLVKNLLAFSSRYNASSLTILGQFTGNLADSGERIVVEGPVGETIHDFRYSSTWYPETLTAGHSLVVVDDSAPRESWRRRESWRPSKFPGGSPGLEEPVPGRQRPGDYNQDGRLNLTDPINLLGHLFVGRPLSLPCSGDLAEERGNLALLDADGNAQVELTDAIVLLRYLFQGGPPHVLGTSCVPIQGCPAETCLP